MSTSVAVTADEFRTRTADVPARQGDSVALARGLSILDVVHECGSVTVASVSDRLGLAPSTTYRLVRQLKDAGYVVEVDGRVQPSAKLSEPMGGRAPAHLVRFASPYLRAMCDRTRLTAILTVRVRTAALCLDWACAHAAHQLSFHRGGARALYAGASATPLLAFAPRTIIEEVLHGPVKRFTGATPATPKEIRAEIQRIRHDRFAVSRGTLSPGMAAVGVPVLVGDQCLCALSLVGEMPFLEEVETALATLRTAAAGLLEDLPSDAVGSTWRSHDDEDENR